ncbi:MAG: pentapeptide repeat-containing protein [Gammaproteobacteria bacterium]|nr:pentapeptide repeat-containing protein [Gammaproteobacteria bacterium]
MRRSATPGCGLATTMAANTCPTRQVACGSLRVTDVVGVAAGRGSIGPVGGVFITIGTFVPHIGHTGQSERGRTMTEAQEHRWYMRRDGHVRGPFPQAQISQYILLGRIRQDDTLSTDREIWTLVRDLPQLIPDIMKHADTEEGRQRLQEARMRADERRGGERRLGSERMSADAGERRREGDRRQGETGETGEVVRQRKIRRGRVIEAGHALDDTRLCGPQCKIVLAVVFLLALVFVVFTPDAPEGHTDCSAPAAPQVNWNNCKMPGLEAEQANLRAAQARNMDLTNARLVGANLIGSDLAYTLLSLADLRHADLSNARMTGAGLRGADLRGARLAGADLSYADLREAHLDGAVLAETRFDSAIWIDGRTCKAGSVGRCQ